MHPWYQLRHARLSPGPSLQASLPPSLAEGREGCITHSTHARVHRCMGAQQRFLHAVLRCWLACSRHTRFNTAANTPPHAPTADAEARFVSQTHPHTTAVATNGPAMPVRPESTPNTHTQRLTRTSGGPTNQPQATKRAPQLSRATKHKEGNRLNRPPSQPQAAVALLVRAV